MKNILLNNWLEISVMKNGDLSLVGIEHDRNTGDMVESTTAIYVDRLDLPSGVVSLLVKRAIFHKQISSVDELTKLTIGIVNYCADEFKKLNDRRNW